MDERYPEEFINSVADSLMSLIVDFGVTYEFDLNGLSIILSALWNIFPSLEDGKKANFLSVLINNNFSVQLTIFFSINPGILCKSLEGITPADFIDFLFTSLSNKFSEAKTCEDGRIDNYYPPLDFIELPYDPLWELYAEDPITPIFHFCGTSESIAEKKFPIQNNVEGISELQDDDLTWSESDSLFFSLLSQEFSSGFQLHSPPMKYTEKVYRKEDSSEVNSISETIVVEFCQSDVQCPYIARYLYLTCILIKAILDVNDDSMCVKPENTILNMITLSEKLFESPDEVDFSSPVTFDFLVSLFKISTYTGNFDLLPSDLFGMLYNCLNTPSNPILTSTLINCFTSIACDPFFWGLEISSSFLDLFIDNGDESSPLVSFMLNQGLFAEFFNLFNVLWRNQDIIELLDQSFVRSVLILLTEQGCDDSALESLSLFIKMFFEVFDEEDSLSYLEGFVDVVFDLLGTHYYSIRLIEAGMYIMLYSNYIPEYNFFSYCAKRISSASDDTFLKGLLKAFIVNLYMKLNKPCEENE